jgi:hypothetical protein
MPQRSRFKAKGRMESGGFSALPHVVQESQNWAQCSPMAIKLLMDLLGQFKGSNNGDLSAALSVLKSKGWTRGQTISNAARELIYYGMIEMTRQGDLHRCSLFAVTWRAIDQCSGKPEVKATNVASRLWANTKPPYVRPIKKCLAAKRPSARPQTVLADERPHAH